MDVPALSDWKGLWKALQVQGFQDYLFKGPFSRKLPHKVSICPFNLEIPGISQYVEYMCNHALWKHLESYQMFPRNILLPGKPVRSSRVSAEPTFSVWKSPFGWLAPTWARKRIFASNRLNHPFMVYLYRWLMMVVEWYIKMQSNLASRKRFLLLYGCFDTQMPILLEV